MLVTLWVFIGVEGAVVMSGRAKSKSDVGKATVIGLVSVLLIYVLITVLSMGVMTREELAALPTPTMAYVFEAVVGKWGAVLINIGLIISIMGAWLSWTLFAAELPYEAAKDKVFPKWLAKENKNKAPVNSLWLTNGLVQVFLITLLFTDKAYNFMFSLASSAILIPYMLSAFYQVKLIPFRENKKQFIIGIIASIYTVWLVYAAGLDYLLLTMLLYAPGIIIYKYTQKDYGITRKDAKFEIALMGIFVILAVIAFVGIITGKIDF